MEGRASRPSAFSLWAETPEAKMHAVAKYWAIFRTQVVNRAAYPVDLLGRSFSIIIFMWVFVQLWRATYGAVGQPAIAGLTLRETLWYLALAETIELSKPRLARGIAQTVRDGSVAYLLNKPYDFLLYQLCIGLGDSVLLVGANALAGGAVIWLAAGPPPDPRGWLLVLPAVAGAWLIHFCFDAMIGLAAFVTEDVAAFEWIYQKLVMILGGLLIPLDFFPGWLRAIAQSLPFAYVLYGPARLFVQPDPGRFAALMLGQAVWLGALAVLVTILYRRGLAWVTINGG